jgi:hypothetical protein
VNHPDAHPAKVADNYSQVNTVESRIAQLTPVNPENQSKESNGYYIKVLTEIIKMSDTGFTNDIVVGKSTGRFLKMRKLLGAMTHACNARCFGGRD